MITIPAYLSDDDLTFPDANQALIEPDGLLAVGGDLRVQRIINAYQAGVFPWYEKGQPILWWSPNPRAIFELDDFKLSKSLAKLYRQNRYHISYDRAFEQVIEACAAPRAGAAGTWITNEMRMAYIELHKQGYAHSIEVWDHEQLVGGLYGLAIGRVFCGESMFSKVANTSKLALYQLTLWLKYWHYDFIDCQLDNPHLMSLGASLISRRAFLARLNTATDLSPSSQAWG